MLFAARWCILGGVNELSVCSWSTVYSEFLPKGLVQGYPTGVWYGTPFELGKCNLRF